MRKYLDKELIETMTERLSALPHYRDLSGKVSPTQFIESIADAIRELRDSKGWPTHAIVQELVNGGLDVGATSIRDLVRSTIKPKGKKRKPRATAGNGAAEPPRLEHPTPPPIEPPALNPPVVPLERHEPERQPAMAASNGSSTPAGRRRAALREDF